MERDIETHIEKDKEILQDPTISIHRCVVILKMNLRNLERYHKKEHPEDHHDPTAFECIVMKIQNQTSVGFTKIDGRRVII